MGRKSRIQKSQRAEEGEQGGRWFDLPNSDGKTGCNTKSLAESLRLI